MTYQGVIVWAGRAKNYHPGCYFCPFTSYYTPTVQIHQLSIIPLKSLCYSTSNDDSIALAIIDIAIHYF
jgi:hypothetical protein